MPPIENSDSYSLIIFKKKRRLKGELRGEKRQVWVAGYSNLVHAYVPNRRVLMEGGYEGTEAVIYQSLPGPFSVELEERIVDTVHRLVHAAKSK